VSDHLTPAGRSRVMAAIRSKNTKPELAVRYALRRRGASGYRVHVAALPGRPDIAFTRWRVAIFLDGAFWHGHPAHFNSETASEYWRAKIARTQERDRLANQQLQAAGWTVLRFWDFEVKKRLDDLVRDIEAALRAANGNDQSTIYADWSLTAHRRGQTQQALELAQQALHLAETSQDRQALAQAHNMLGMLVSRQGDADEARHHLEQSMRLAESLDDPGMRAAALNNLAQVYRSGGDIDRALGLTEAALALCIAQGDRHHEAALHSNLADLQHAAGRSEEAMAHLKQAVGIYAEIGVEAGDVQPAIWKLSEW